MGKTGWGWSGFRLFDAFHTAEWCQAISRSFLDRARSWEALTEDEQEGFAPLCPDFVIELRSRSDNLPPLEDKMPEYIANGAQMAWLIDPVRKRVYVYRPSQRAEILEDPQTVSGDPELLGFKLELRELW